MGNVRMIRETLHGKLLVSETCRCSHPLLRLRFRTTLKTFPSTSPLTQWGGDVLRSDKYHSAQWKSKKRFNSGSQSFKTLIYGEWVAMNCIETESGKVFCLFYLLSFLRRGAWRGEEGSKGRAGVKQTISTLGLMTLELNSNEHFANSRA